VSDPIRTAIIGYGLAGRVFHAPLISADPAFELAGIVTADASRSAAAASLYPGAQILSTVEELLAADGFELVVVGAPTPDHAAIATRTLERGLATVVDKPLAVRSVEAAELIELADLRGVPLTVFQNRRWDGDFLTVRKLVESGAFGDVWRFESRFEWHSVRPRPQWKQETAGAGGGGVAYDLGAHLIDQAVQLFGPVESYYGELDRHRPGAVNDDDTFIALTHTSGVRSHLAMSSMVAQRGSRFRVLGSESGFVKWGLDPQESQLASGMSPLDEGYGVEPAEAWGKLGRDADAAPVPTERGGYREFYSRLAASLRDGAPLPVDPRDALVAIGIVESLHAQKWN
jgi:scyllo-inositol 2-dehydrogenase (NADP+)